MLCAVIMAGGRGTRFWPLSTEDKPKQFLKLLGNHTMLQMTVQRIEHIIPKERIFICTGKNYVPFVREQLPDLPVQNIIQEPEGRNTAACIALSAFYIKRYFKETEMLVLPADHLIENEEAFRTVIEEAAEYTKLHSKTILTVGIKPNRPETEYGYIQYDEETLYKNKWEIKSVKSFKEKPTEETARAYLKEGHYLWNAGMFMWQTHYILEQIKFHLKGIYEVLKPIETIDETKLQDFIDENYKNCESISIDYGVLEKAKEIKVIPCDLGWDDIGNWNAIERYREKDRNKNIVDGNVEVINSNNNIIISNDKKIVFYNIENLFCVDTEDVMIVTNKAHIGEIKLIKEKIKRGAL